MPETAVLVNLEIALIDLEYATSEITYRETSRNDENGLDLLVTKLVEANRAVQRFIYASIPTREDHEEKDS